MIKYKLIKEYPGSPKLGTIVKQHEIKEHLFVSDCNFAIQFPWYFPEFWEETEESLTNDTDSHSWGFENFEVIKTEEDAKIFVETMENIPEPNDKLKKAFKDFNKQETLEEAKVNNLINLFGKDYDLEPRCVIESCNDSLIYGVEWQQEKCEKDLDAHLDIAKTLWLQVVKENKKMYSEEEVHNILNSYKSFISSGMKIPYFEWFEQFKK